MSQDEKFLVGLKMTLSINDSEEKEIVTLIGWETNSFIVVKHPLLRTMRLTSSDDCVLRFVRDGVAYGFQTNMISMQYNPVPLIFFKFPTEIKSISFRRSKRVQTNIDAKMLMRMKDNTFMTADVRILDISETGCLIEIPAHEKINDEIHVRSKFYVHFLILDKNIEIDCIVRNIRQKNNFILLGTEFSDANTETKQVISSFITYIDSVSHQ